MLEKFIEGIVAGGPAYALLGVMLWLGIRQAEKHEANWVRLADGLSDLQEKDIDSRVKLTEAVTEMRVLIERLTDRVDRSSESCPAMKIDPEETRPKRVAK